MVFLFGCGSVSNTGPAAISTGKTIEAVYQHQEGEQVVVAKVALDLSGDPYIGVDDAPINLVEFIDYECPYCQRAHHEVVDLLYRKYEGAIRITFKQLPLKFHQKADFAARGALAASALGFFREMHYKLFENSISLKRDDIVKYASELGMNPIQFAAMMDSESSTRKVQSDSDTAKRLGVTVLPFFFVNGRPLRGLRPLPVFEEIIENELAGSGGPIRWVSRVDEVTGSSNADRLPRSNSVLRQELEQLRREVETLRRELSNLRSEVRSSPAPADSLGDAANDHSTR